MNNIEILSWIEKYAEGLTSRGPMYGSFAMQETSMHMLISFKNLIQGKPNSLIESRESIAHKYQLLTTLSFSDQIINDFSNQEKFSNLLKDWFYFDHE